MFYGPKTNGPPGKLKGEEEGGREGAGVKLKLDAMNETHTCVGA